MQFIKDSAPRGCPFCIDPDPQAAPEGLVVAKGSKVFAVLNRFPYNTGHVLILPYRHVGELEDLSDSELDELGRFTRATVTALRSAYSPAGFNIGANLGGTAGGSIPDHLHYHVVPRFPGDTNFMSVLGETKVLPEELPDTVTKLRRSWPLGLPERDD